MPYDLPLSGVTSLEDDLKQTKKIYGKALTKLVKKIKHLEAKLKSTTERRKARMVISDDEEDLVSEDTSKQGRMTETEYEEFEIDLNQTDDDLQRRSIIDEIDLSKILAYASRERVKTYTRRKITDSSRDSTAGGLFSTAEEGQSKEKISTDEKEMARAAVREKQERIDFEKALELQKQLDEIEETDNIDWNTVAEQVQERQSDIIKRYQTLKKKPVSVAQARKNMMIYLKNMARYKMGYFKGMSYDEIIPIFKVEYNKIQTLIKKDTQVKKTKTKRIAKETLLQENWEIHTKGSRKYWKIIRVRNITEAYQVFEDMLKGFDREDFVTLWSLVKERFRSAEPIEYKERALWVELKRLFEPDKDDVLWKLQRYMYDPLT
ncbi:hypothetical protein Tco_0438366 [Tanacetum coccineum]